MSMNNYPEYATAGGAHPVYCRIIKESAEKLRMGEYYTLRM
jgi:hypothetical protein